MNTVLKNYRFQSFNKKKKTWRSLMWAFAPRKRRRKLVYLFVLLPAFRSCLFISPAERTDLQRTEKALCCQGGICGRNDGWAAYLERCRWRGERARPFSEFKRRGTKIVEESGAANI